MELFNIGLGEMFLIFIIALLVFGPERLPDLARQTARFLNQLRGMADEVQKAIMAESQEITRPITDTKNEIQSIATPFKDVKKTLAAPLITPQTPTAQAPATPTTPTATSTPEPEQARSYEAPESPPGAEVPAPLPGLPLIAEPKYKPVSRNGNSDDGNV